MYCNVLWRRLQSVVGMHDALNCTLQRSLLYQQSCPVLLCTALHCNALHCTALQCYTTLHAVILGAPGGRKGRLDHVLIFRHHLSSHSHICIKVQSISKWDHSATAKMQEKILNYYNCRYLYIVEKTPSKYFFLAYNMPLRPADVWLLKNLHLLKSDGWSEGSFKLNLFHSF